MMTASSCFAAITAAVMLSMVLAVTTSHAVIVTDNVFSAASPTLDVCSPSLPTYPIGQDIQIEWTSFNLFQPASVSLDLYRIGAGNTATFERTIESSTTDTGSYTWQPINSLYPTVSSGSAITWKVRVASVEQPSAFNFSSPFVLTSSWTRHVVAPNIPGSTAAGPIDGAPFNSRYFGQRFAALYTFDEVVPPGANHSSTYAVVGIGIKLAGAVSVFPNQVRIDATLVPKSTLGLTNTWFEDTHTYINVRLRDDSFFFLPSQIGTFLQLNFTTPITIGSDFNVVFEFSSRANPSGFPTDSIQPVYVNQTGSDTYKDRAVATVAIDPEWKFDLFPYPPQNPIHVYSVIPKASFNTIELSSATPNPISCLESRQQNVIPSEAWNTLIGSNDIAADCGRANTPACRSGSVLFVEPESQTMFLFGGAAIDPISGQATELNDLWKYSISSSLQAWTQVFASDCSRSDRPACRQKHTAVPISDTYFAVYGGQQVLTGPITNDSEIMWVFDASTLTDDRWLRVAPSSTRGSFGHTAVGYQGAMYVYGGVSAEPTVRITNQLFKATFDVNTTPIQVTWTDLTVGSASSLTTAVCTNNAGDAACVTQHSAAVVNDEMVIVAGQLAPVSTRASSNGYYVYSLTSQAWITKKPSNCQDFTRPNCRHSAGMATTFDKSVQLFGGNVLDPILGTSIFGNDVWLFNSSTAIWTRKSYATCTVGGNQPPCTAQHNMAVLGRLIMSFGGLYNAQGATTRINSLWMYREIMALYDPQTKHENLNTTGGDVVTVEGINFDKFINPEVYVGNSKCLASSVVGSGSNMTMSCTVPPGVGANVNVRVRGVDKVTWFSNAAPLISYRAPIISNISIVDPLEVFPLLSIIGSNFGPPQAASQVAVYFGSKLGLHTVLQSQTLITTVVPPQFGFQVPITVQVGNQQSNIAALRWNYTSPSVTSFLPTTAGTSGGTILTIQGGALGDSDLGSIASVAVGNRPCTNVQWKRLTNSTEELLCTIAPGVGANLPVTVTVVDQSNVAAATFSYDAPRIYK
jgi:IPT/TIG domain